jgi:hypothetical protein
MNRGRAGWLVLPLLALAACAGKAVDASPPANMPKPVACHAGDHNETPEQYYDCVDGAWKPGTAPTTTTLVKPKPPETLPLPIPTTPPTTTAPTTTAPATTQPATTTPKITSKSKTSTPKTTATTQPRKTTMPTAPGTRPISTPETIPNPGYLFRYKSDGTPIAWAPCQVMHWLYNPAGEPSPETLAVVEAAMAELNQDSGIEVVYDGVSSINVAGTGALNSLAPGQVVIGFAPPGSPAIPLSGDAMGAALPANVDPNAYVGGSTVTAPNSQYWIINAAIALNLEDAARIPLDFSSNGSFGAGLLHELGHAVGLQHVAASSQLMGMWGASWNTHGHYGTGDKAGLATLQGRACDTPPVDTTPDTTVPSTVPPTTTPPTTTPPTTTEPPTTTTPPTTTSPTSTIPPTTMPPTTTSTPPTTEPPTTTSPPTDG